MTDAPAAASPPAPTAPKVRIERRGALVNFILDRPKALNAFDDEMRRAVAEEIPRVARNPDVYIVALTSASPRAFCAGGDVRALVAAAKTDMPRVRSYFAAEYQLDWLLDCFSKPTVSLIEPTNGSVLGAKARISLMVLAPRSRMSSSVNTVMGAPMSFSEALMRVPLRVSVAR